MNKLAEAGIYVLIALPDGDLYWSTHEYHKRMIDAFQKYSNTLGFYISMTDKSVSSINDVTWKKAELQYMKEHIASRSYRDIPVGYSLFHRQISGLVNFINCGNKSTSADFIIFDKSYDLSSECSDPSLLVTDALIEDYRGFDIPSLFDFGCTANSERNFEETQHIFSNKALEVFSGGMVYEWQDNWGEGYGLGKSFLVILPELKSNQL
jgi:Glucanosyltransferase